VNGEGCFSVKVKKNKKIPQVLLTFSVSQHSRYANLLNIIKTKYLKSGVIESISTRSNSVNFVIYKINDILDKIIPFLKKIIYLVASYWIIKIFLITQYTFNRTRR
jgi:hypothetical protein